MTGWRREHLIRLLKFVDFIRDSLIVETDFVTLNCYSSAEAECK